MIGTDYKAWHVVLEPQVYVGKAPRSGLVADRSARKWIAIGGNECLVASCFQTFLLFHLRGSSVCLWASWPVSKYHRVLQ